MFSSIFPHQSGFNVTKHVVIIGGGFAECAAAMTIKKIDDNIRITIIERAADIQMENIDDKNGHSHIEQSLSPHVTSSLKHLNLWQHFLESHLSLMSFIQSLQIDYVNNLQLNKLTQSAKKTWLLDFSNMHNTEYTIEADFIIDDNKQHTLGLCYAGDQSHVHYSFINVQEFFRLATHKNLQFARYEL